MEQELGLLDYRLDLGGEETFGKHLTAASDQYATFREENPYLHMGVDIGMGALSLFAPKKYGVLRKALNKAILTKAGLDIGSDVIAREKINALDVLPAAVPIGSALANSFLAADTKAFMRALSSPTGIADATLNPISKASRYVGKKADSLKTSITQGINNSSNQKVQNLANAYRKYKGVVTPAPGSKAATIMNIPGNTVKGIKNWIWSPGDHEILDMGRKFEAGNIRSSTRHISDQFVLDYYNQLEQINKLSPLEIYNRYVKKFEDKVSYSEFLKNPVKYTKEAAYIETSKISDRIVSPLDETVSNITGKARRRKAVSASGETPGSLQELLNTITVKTSNLDEAYASLGKFEDLPGIALTLERLRTKPRRILASVKGGGSDVGQTLEKLFERRAGRGLSELEKQTIREKGYGQFLKNKRARLQKLRETAVSSGYSTGFHRLGMAMMDVGSAATTVKYAPELFNFGYGKPESEEI